MAYRAENRSVWDDINDLLTRLYNAMRNGYSNLINAIRQALARLGYYDYAYQTV